MTGGHVGDVCRQCMLAACTSVDTLDPGASLRKMSSGKGLQNSLAVNQVIGGPRDTLMANRRTGDRSPYYTH
jgi:hypothetical protein